MHKTPPWSWVPWDPNPQPFILPHVPSCPTVVMVSACHVLPRDTLDPSEAGMEEPELLFPGEEEGQEHM